MIGEKTTEEIRELFGITNDLTPEEDEANSNEIQYLEDNRDRVPKTRFAEDPYGIFEKQEAERVAAGLPAEPAAQVNEETEPDIQNGLQHAEDLSYDDDDYEYPEYDYARDDVTNKGWSDQDMSDEEGYEDSYFYDSE
jgi:hypothetical protein